jgi:cytidylate kinase
MVRPAAKRRAQTMVNEQVRKWRMEEQEGASASEARPPWPIITVSREFGSLGATIGGEVAQRLGFSFWDQEILHIIAQETGAQQSLLETLDERVRGRIEDFISEQIMGTKSTVASYVAHVVRVVRSFAEHGGAVVVGRGSQFIVDPTVALRVRVVCPREVRVSGYAERQAISTEKAMREVDRQERERQEFHRRYYQRDVNDATAYDLVINTESLSTSASVELLLEAYRLKFGRLPQMATLSTAPSISAVAAEG